MTLNREVGNGLERSVIGILGGTGPQGRGLTKRFVESGLEVVLGSRSAERAVVAAELGAGVRGAPTSTASAPPTSWSSPCRGTVTANWLSRWRRTSPARSSSTA